MPPQKREPDRYTSVDEQPESEKAGEDGFLQHLMRRLARHERDAEALNKTMRQKDFRRHKESKH